MKKGADSTGKLMHILIPKDIRPAVSMLIDIGL